MCDSDDKINELIRMVNDVLSPNGWFIVSFYDGSNIIKKMKNKVLKLNLFDITLVSETDKYAIASMPLLTIDTELYREEHPVLDRHTKIMEDKLTLMDSFCLTLEIEKDLIKDVESVVDYMKFIKYLDCR
jgi:hypothetical protein